MNHSFRASTDVSPAALKAVIRQAQDDRAAFVAAILIGFGKKIKGLVSRAERVPTVATRVAPMAR
jgi:hypothetical protein